MVYFFLKIPLTFLLTELIHEAHDLTQEDTNLPHEEIDYANEANELTQEAPDFTRAAPDHSQVDPESPQQASDLPNESPDRSQQAPDLSQEATELSHEEPDLAYEVHDFFQEASAHGAVLPLQSHVHPRTCDRRRAPSLRFVPGHLHRDQRVAVVQGQGGESVPGRQVPGAPVGNRLRQRGAAAAEGRAETRARMGRDDRGEDPGL